MKAFEISTTYYHGSNNKLPVGTILSPRHSEYESDWGDTSFYQILEKYRPTDKLSHKDSVFNGSRS